MADVGDDDRFLRSCDGKRRTGRIEDGTPAEKVEPASTADEVGDGEEHRVLQRASGSRDHTAAPPRHG